jgi:hypothetical protein
VAGKKRAWVGAYSTNSGMTECAVVSGNNPQHAMHNFSQQHDTKRPGVTCCVIVDANGKVAQSRGHPPSVEGLRAYVLRTMFNADGTPRFSKATVIARDNNKSKEAGEVVTEALAKIANETKTTSSLPEELATVYPVYTLQKDIDNAV